MDNLDRVKRASLHQKEALIQFMEQYPEVGNERMSTHYDIYYRREKWNELTEILNKLPGKPKTPEKWQKAWQDWRYNTRKKTEKYGDRCKLSSMEQRVLTITNLDSADIYQPTTEIIIEGLDITDGSMDNEHFEIKEEDASNELSSNDFSNMLETKIIELPTETLKAKRNDRVKPRIKKKYVYYDRNNVREIHRVAKCVEKSTRAMMKICEMQMKTQERIVDVLQENTRLLQSISEYQMRQAEALERETSLEESRNSILKLMASTLSSMKKY